jgi:hypothetical protein
MNIPLKPLVREDRLISKAEKNGKYSVRLKFVNEIVDNSHLHTPGLWDLILNIKSPPKIKNLVCRVCCDCLPTQARLNSRGVPCPTDCVICGSNFENNIDGMSNSVKVWCVRNLWFKIDYFIRV